MVKGKVVFTKYTRICNYIQSIRLLISEEGIQESLSHFEGRVSNVTKPHVG